MISNRNFSQQPAQPLPQQSPAVQSQMRVVYDQQIVVKFKFPQQLQQQDCLKHVGLKLYF
jgi:hypothetical protein